MRTDRFMLGDWVLINGVPRRIESITKKKVGYHTCENECRMHYARIHEVEPIPLNPQTIKKFGFIEHPGNRKVFPHKIFGRDVFIYKDYNEEYHLNIVCSDCPNRCPSLYIEDADELQRALRIFGYNILVGPDLKF